MGKRPSKEKSVPLPLTVSRPLYEYLTWLSQNTTMGSRETEVASLILRSAIREMIKNKEHEITFPRDNRAIEGNDDDGEIG